MESLKLKFLVPLSISTVASSVLVFIWNLNPNFGYTLVCDLYTCCSHCGSVDNPDQNNFQKNFTKILNKIFFNELGHLTLDSNLFHSIGQ